MKSVYLALAGLSFAYAEIPQPWAFNATTLQWQATDDWAVGGNFIPSSAVNQLEMWQAETWDPETIDRELGFAANLVFAWARLVAPSQPLTSCLWRTNPWGDFDRLTVLEQLCVTESDVISFHNYGDLEGITRRTESLRGYEKPIMCTEYMARGQNSTFDPNLGYLQAQHISAFNWGVVSGKTQTIYPWDSALTPNPYEGVNDPDPWFHDIFRPDGTARYEQEAEYIKNLIAAGAAAKGV